MYYTKQLEIENYLVRMYVEFKQDESEIWLFYFKSHMQTQSNQLHNAYVFLLHFRNDDIKVTFSVNYSAHRHSRSLGINYRHVCQTNKYACVKCTIQGLQTRSTLTKTENRSEKTKSSTTTVAAVATAILKISVVSSYWMSMWIGAHIHTQTRTRLHINLSQRTT